MTTLTIKYAKGITVELASSLKPISIRSKEDGGFCTKEFVGVLDNYVELLENMMTKYPGSIETIGVN